LNHLEYHHEILWEQGMVKLGRVRKWLYSDVLRHAGCDLTFMLVT